MTKQDLGCLLEARHPLVVPKVSQVGLKQTDKDNEREQNEGLIASARVITRYENQTLNVVDSQ